MYRYNEIIVCVKEDIVSMTIWTPQLSQDKPIYLAIADAMAGDIMSGKLNVGDKLPPHPGCRLRQGDARRIASMLQAGWVELLSLIHIS